ncbi:hypothetical protein GCM10011609_71400 [Lentzea pudingi]|uniref:Acetyltransferase (Isoleucine patch superfamily) n=1 Tax=Lentzea pudingi TaxID=1789439 RepID=A0ABQ2IM94_9PSEU|nr:acyltransferase [Lentzea pudingi]GGN19964.1 hypothetical protein GCM10011609_71400 [Lentzea pudingi]
MQSEHAPVRGASNRGFLGYLNAYRLRALGAAIGAGTPIPLSTRIADPPRIKIGAGVAIQRNSTFDGTSPDRVSLIVGDHCRLKENIWCAAYGGRIEIGHNVLIGRNSIVHGHGGVTIGPWSMMGPGVMILSSEHGHFLTVDRTPFQLQTEAVAPVVIESNVWIGAGATVLPGVTIHSDVVIGAGAVVVKSLESGFVYAGVPAIRVAKIGHRLDQDF